MLQPKDMEKDLATVIVALGRSVGIDGSAVCVRRFEVLNKQSMHVGSILSYIGI